MYQYIVSIWVAYLSIHLKCKNVKLAFFKSIFTRWYNKLMLGSIPFQWISSLLPENTLKYKLSIQIEYRCFLSKIKLIRSAYQMTFVIIIIRPNRTYIIWHYMALYIYAYCIGFMGAFILSTKYLYFCWWWQDCMC